MPTREEITEAILNGDRHPVDDADSHTTEALEWVSFYHEADDGGHVAVDYDMKRVETWDGEEPTPNTVYGDE